MRRKIVVTVEFWFNIVGDRSKKEALSLCENEIKRAVSRTRKIGLVRKVVGPGIQISVKK